jgi:hypothetical protein
MDQWREEYMKKIEDLTAEARGYYEHTKKRGHQAAIVIIILASLLILNFIIDGAEHFHDLRIFFHMY